MFKVIFGSKSRKNNWFEELIIHLHDMHMQKRKFWCWFFQDTYQGLLGSFLGLFLKKAYYISSLLNVAFQIRSNFEDNYKDDFKFVFLVKSFMILFLGNFKSILKFKALKKASIWLSTAFMWRSNPHLSSKP